MMNFYYTKAKSHKDLSTKITFFIVNLTLPAKLSFLQTRRQCKFHLQPMLVLSESY